MYIDKDYFSKTKFYESTYSSFNYLLQALLKYYNVNTEDIDRLKSLIVTVGALRDSKLKHLSYNNNPYLLTRGLKKALWPLFLSCYDFYGIVGNTLEEKERFFEEHYTDIALMIVNNAILGDEKTSFSSLKDWIFEPLIDLFRKDEYLPLEGPQKDPNIKIKVFQEEKESKQKTYLFSLKENQRKELAVCFQGQNIMPLDKLFYPLEEGQVTEHLFPNIKKDIDSLLNYYTCISYDTYINKITSIKSNIDPFKDIATGGWSMPGYNNPRNRALNVYLNTLNNLERAITNDDYNLVFLDTETGEVKEDMSIKIKN